MASYGYMTITGNRQGMISAGCSTPDSIGNKCQSGHTDEIMVLSFTHRMSNVGNTPHSTHHPIVVTKAIDKSSPLLAQALASREEIECQFHFYRVSPSGGQEKYYSIEIKGGQLAELVSDVPHAVLQNETEGQEVVSLRYQTIRWTHHIAGTSGYTYWGADK
ncbi:Hcp family type VI secretion system effector [Pseudomonas sp. BBP2017]|uniref:Hcp family type VI secretion system effector n=1 Tax=Pseudomonas sp. BBP2017 TaxID=2109731 RepID=UPI000D129141|nr:Hcp family type VI secretion system effector [Pseudomonas sp. BBP2017]PSS57690.1 type VI secretion system tube protein Hcp [Pseudomonas sp. BBP2017]